MTGLRSFGLHLAATLLAVGGFVICGPSFAAPMANSHAAMSVAPATIQTVQWDGRWRGSQTDWRGARAYAGGLALGANGYSYRGPAYDAYYSGNYYNNRANNYGYGNYNDNYAYRNYRDNYADNYAYDTYANDNYYYGGVYNTPISCAQRFRSYDPVTQTYRGYDGIRHPCP